MDYDEFWKKWLSSVVEEIVRNNIIKSREGIQTPTSFVGDS